MGLIDRLTATDNTKIGAHGFSAALFLLAKGKLTRAQIVASYSLSTEDEVQLDLLIAEASAATEGALLYAKRVEAVAILVEEERVTGAQATGLLDI